jgi:hypothetical protein
MTQKTVHEVPASHLLAAVLQRDSILSHIQLETFRLLPGISIEELRQMLRDELLRPEMISGEDAQEAQMMLDRINDLRKRGLTMTQTLNAVTSPIKTTDEDEDDAFQIITNDKRGSSGGG